MRKLFQRVIAVVLCFSLLNNIDFSMFAKAEESMETLQTVSQNETVSDGNVAAEFEVKVHFYLKSDNSGAATEEIFIPQYFTAQNGDAMENLNREGYEVVEIIADGATVFSKDDAHPAFGGSLEINDADNDGVVDVSVIYDGTIGTLENEVTIFDYTNGRASDNKSVNYTGNYPSDVPYNQRMSTNGAERDYVTLVEQKNGDGASAVARTFNINAYERFEYTNGIKGSVDYKYRYPILEGLLLGLSGDNYENVNFRFADPGFFANDGGVGKTVEEGYEFVFDRDGFEYKLTSVVNDARGSRWTDLSNFFPLPELVSYSNGRYQYTKNSYFGIRYDFNIVLGDYIGDMIYSFTGDDDLWVCLDGEVILDIGGVHGKYPNLSGEYRGVTYAPGSVDVWEKLLGAGYTQQDKIDYLLDTTTDANGKTNATREHRVTVLYMERGGNESNCNISFVMPYVVVEPPVVTSTASLFLNKVDKDTKEALSEVAFELSDGSVTYNGITDENGGLTFSGLTAGTYTLTETVPEGYKQAGPWTVTVSEIKEGNIITTYVASVSPELVKDGDCYIIENKKYDASLVFTKVDSVDNAPLKGASFQLVNKEGTMTYNRTADSDENGVVEFTGLSLGEYILTETAAPSGYIKSAGSWDVVVTESGEVITVKLFDGDNEVTQIENIPAESVIDYNKTATLLNNEDRTYTINLSAETKSITIPGENKAVDIVLTIDNSRSMLFPAELTAYNGTLSKDNVYYYYSGTNATVNVVWYAKNSWHTMDSSEWKYNGSDSKNYNVERNDKDQTYSINKDTQYYTSESYTSQLTAAVGDVMSGIDPKHGRSNKYDRMQVLKNAVALFLDELKNDSPDSQIAIVTFGGENASNRTSGLTDITSAKEVLASVQISADGGTPTQKGLEDSKKVLNTADEKDDFVVLISDGLQTTGNATTAANAIKADGTRLICLGLNISNVATAEEFLKNLSSDNTVYLANNAEALVAALGVISGEITQGIVLENVQVVDYIDPRFEITEDSKEVLKAAGATIWVADGNEVVIWNGVTLTNTPWNGEIIVKAKNDFLGGDEVPTNGPESGIVINGTILKFPIPKVDVRLLDLSIIGGKTTVFIEDSILPETYWKDEVEGTLKSVYVNSKKQSFENAMAALSDEKRNELFATGTCTVPYYYGDIQFGNLIYAVDGAPLDEHVATAVGNPYETYNFNVTYEALDRTNGSTKLFGSTSATCDYMVDVVAGTITIEKTVYGSDFDAIQGDPIFTFKIMKDGAFYAYRTVRFTEATVSGKEGEVTLKANILNELSKGDYTVEELDTIRFACNCVNAEGTGVYPAGTSVDGGAAKVEIGYGSDGKASKRDASVEFINSKNNDRNFSDTDVVVNTCSFDSQGNLIWTGDDLTGTSN